MFLGHVGIALGAKSLVPRISLGTLLAAALFIDLLWPILLLLGLTQIRTSADAVETTALHFTNFSYDQSLLAVIFWAFLFAGVYYLVRRCPREAWICALVVASNWVLDLITLHPDLKLVPGITIRAGLSIAEYLPAVLAVELTIFILGIGIYCYYTKASDRIGRSGFWSIMVLLVAVTLTALLASVPQHPFLAACCGQSLWLLVIWGYWIEKHRNLRWLYN